MATNVAVDAITGEVIESGLRYVVREMRATLIRLSYSPILYETHDFSCALLDPEGEIVAMSVDVPLHVFPISFGVRHLHEKYAGDMHEGDVFLVNDPWIAGTHLNDVLLIRPIFVDGELELYAAVRAHYGDVGGMMPGSISGASTEILHEGIRMPMVKIYDRGELNEEILAIFLNNVRAPFQAEGVFYAQAAVNRLAENRLAALYERYGTAQVKATLDARKEGARRRMAAAIAELPDGEYYYEDYLENSGGTGANVDPIYVRAKMRIDGEQIAFDFEECSPQRAGVGNADLATTWCGCYTVLETILTEEPSSTSGSVAQLSVTAPEASVLNSSYPVPVGGFADILFGPVQGCALALLSQVVPERVCALAGSSANQTSIGGPSNPRRPGEGWFIYEFPWAGWPATADLDGNLGISNWYMGDLPSIWPVERGELALPLRVVYSGIRADSGGPGHRRGGNGLVRAWEVLAPGQFSFLGSEGIIPRAGMSGGYGAALNRLEVMRDGELLELGEIPLKIGGFGLQEGDVVVTYAAGGAGYGDPLKREPERVAEDVRDGYVSLEGAADDYGVVLADGEVDAAATEARRGELRDARVRLEVEVTAADEFDDKGLRVGRLSPAAAERLGVGDGDLIELVPEARPSLRAWVVVDESVGERLPIGPLGARACGVDAGGTLLVRPPWGHAKSVTGFPPELERSLELLRGISA